jgi:hypothetical protein
MKSVKFRFTIHSTNGLEMLVTASTEENLPMPTRARVIVKILEELLMF